MIVLSIVYNRVSRLLNGNDMFITRDSLLAIHKQFYSHIQPVYSIIQLIILGCLYCGVSRGFNH